MPRRARLRLLAASALLFATTAGLADVVVIKAAKVITITGEEIPRGIVVINDGKVELVGLGLEYPAGATVIDASTETIMPGLILASTRAGIPGPARSGVNCHQNVLDELFPGAIDEERYLSAGFTTIGLAPAGTSLPGTAAAWRTGGPEESRVLNKAAYLRATMNRMPGDKTTLAGALRRARAEIERVEKARKEWETKQEEERKKAEAEKAQQPKPEGQPPPQGTQPPPTSQPTQPGQRPPPPSGQPQGQPPATPAKFEPPKIDPPHEPLVHLIEKKPGPALIFEVGSASDVVHTLDVMKDWEDVPYSFNLSGGADFNYIVDRLGEQKAAVIVDPVISRLPNTVIRYNLPGELHRAGCAVALSPTSDSPAAFEAYLGMTADLVRSGMPRDAALKAVTLEPAKRLRIDANVGAIAKGKDADIIFLSGDPLDPASRVSRVMILGEIVWEAAR